MTAATNARHRRGGQATGGVAGNERLTAMTGAVLLVLFAAEGVTILRISRLLTLHFFLGMLAAGPVALKVASTGYRFIRYYSGSRDYIRKGPPALLMRMLGPLVTISSLAVLGTGVALAATGPADGRWLFLHKASFVLWFGVMTIHVLGYAPRLPRLLGRGARERASAVLAGQGLRRLLLAAALAGGLILAAATVRLAGRWDAAQGVISTVRDSV